MDITQLLHHQPHSEIMFLPFTDAVIFQYHLQVDYTTYTVVAKARLLFLGLLFL